MTRPTFSVVIPALDEEERIEPTIAAARKAYGEACELLVVDGGSIDRTREVARRHCRVTVSTGGRGAQQNAGAAETRGEVLVFLHADTRVEAGSGLEIAGVLENAEVVGGCHRFRVDPPASHLGLFALLEAGVNLRTRLFGAATGDQAIFVRRRRFEEVGGFPEYSLFEDIVLVRKLRRLGRFELLLASAATSRRRWEERGFLRTVLFHWTLRAAFEAGVDPERLAARYARGRLQARAQGSPTSPLPPESRRPTARRTSCR